VTRDDPTHRAMVERLTSELVPVRRLWSPWRRLAAWIVLALGTVVLAAVVGLRHDLGAQLDRSHFVVTLAILVFAPLKFLYPSRAQYYRRMSIALGAVWGVLMVPAIWTAPASPPALVWATLLYPAYYVGMSFWLQATGRA